MEMPILLVADYVNVAQGGKLNVMGIFRQIFASTFPAKHPEMFLVIGLSASPAEYETERTLIVKLLTIDAKELLKIERTLKIPKGNNGQRVEMNSIMRFVNTEFPDAGTYEFRVLLDNDEKGHYQIQVIKQEIKGLPSDQKGQ